MFASAWAGSSVLSTGGQVVHQLQRADLGRMIFRVKPEVHCKAVRAAELEGKNLNDGLEEVLGKAAG